MSNWLSRVASIFIMLATAAWTIPLVIFCRGIVELAGLLVKLSEQLVRLVVYAFREGGLLDRYGL